ncbi:1-aminocyclopropane-1-carboxylate oxidase-like protein 1 [Forsythia ovata]|uniref:1-aminocyclopropane-1-carboxylate oxidase-like protein 1 n=1 Tax=Forsythia ovata TaxID=205694 RepID=A0ABD1PIA5_9LAMI
MCLCVCADNKFEKLWKLYMPLALNFTKKMPFTQHKYSNMSRIHSGFTLKWYTMSDQIHITSIKESIAESAKNYDRVTELKAFEDTKAGVKGLVDFGIVNIPKIFIRPPDELAEELKYGRNNLQVPVIDFTRIESHNRSKKIIDEVRRASKEWGFFQVVNHGIPLSVLDGMLNGIRRFHEQDAEVKKEYYSRDQTKKVIYGSNVDLYTSRAANWRDTLAISMMFSYHVEPHELPSICRSAIMEYINQVTKLGEVVFELLSEALGLKPDHLGGTLECGRGRALVCHYYPACPEPNLTLGTSKHTNPPFLTILLQDQIGGLQVLRDNHWVDVPPVSGSFVVNIGNLLQMTSNDEFKSAEHRVLANRVGPRISVACFFTGVAVPPKIYCPIKELISEENPPLYKEFTVSEYVTKFYSKAIDKSGLEDFKLKG